VNERKTHIKHKKGLPNESPKSTFIRATLPNWFDGQNNELP
jgi:hypothetical protein